MKAVIILLAVLVVTTTAYRGKPKATRYSHHKVEYGDNIDEQSERCCNEILWAFHHDYPNATEFLTQFQSVRNFLVDSYNFCKHVEKSKNNDCVTKWKEGLASAQNTLEDDILEVFPDTGVSHLQEIIQGTNKCVGGRPQH